MSATSKIIPLSEFKVRHRELLQEVTESGEPLVVTVRGRGAFVVQLPEVYYRLVREVTEAQQLQLLHEALQSRPEAEQFMTGRPPYGP